MKRNGNYGGKRDLNSCRINMCEKSDVINRLIEEGI